MNILITEIHYLQLEQVFGHKIIFKNGPLFREKMKPQTHYALVIFLRLETLLIQSSIGENFITIYC